MLKRMFLEPFRERLMNRWYVSYSIKKSRFFRCGSEADKTKWLTFQAACLWISAAGNVRRGSGCKWRKRVLLINACY